MVFYHFFIFLINVYCIFDNYYYNYHDRYNYINFLISLSISIYFFIFSTLNNSINLRRYNVYNNLYQELLNENNYLKNLYDKYDIPKHIKIIYIKHLIENNSSCPICLDDFTSKDELFLTLCGHLFHFECVNSAFIFSDLCPYCKTDYNVDKNNKITI